jgi:hypothetical protein
VSESKFIKDPASFIPHIQSGDTEALAALITNPEVERQLLVRLRKKAMLYAQDFASDGEPLPNCANKGKIDVDCVVDLYESYIIPLTKEIEVRGRLAAMFQQVTSILGRIFTEEVRRVIAGGDRETRKLEAIVFSNLSVIFRHLDDCLFNHTKPCTMAEY